MHVGTFVDDDQRSFKLAHVFRVDAEISLQWERNRDTLGDVDKRSARPNRTVQSGELVVFGGNDFAKVLSQQFGMLANGCVGVGKDHALLGEVFFQRTVDDFAFKLSFHT